MLGDDSSLAKIYSHCYVPICPHCAKDKKYQKYVLKPRVVAQGREIVAKQGEK